jgi:transcription initiation factor TFIID subunit 1, fungi type
VAEQQQIYKSEIDRIWKAQFNSLSRTDEPQLTEDEKEEEKKAAQAPPPLVTPPFPNFTKTTFPYAASFMSPQPAAAPSPAFSRGSSADPDREMSMGPDGNARRVLRIKRLVRFLKKSSFCDLGELIFLSRSMVSGKLKLSGIRL